MTFILAIYTSLILTSSIVIEVLGYRVPLVTSLPIIFMTILILRGFILNYSPVVLIISLYGLFLSVYSFLRVGYFDRDFFLPHIIFISIFGIFSYLKNKNKSDDFYISVFITGIFINSLFIIFFHIFPELRLSLHPFLYLSENGFYQVSNQIRAVGLSSTATELHSVAISLGLLFLLRDLYIKKKNQ